MPAEKSCFFAWARCLRDEDDIAPEIIDPWVISQSDELDEQTSAKNKMINAWAAAKSNRAALLKYKHKSSPSDDQIYVNTGAVQVSHKELFTCGLICCCAIGFTYNGQNFLAHVTPGMDAEVIIAAIDDNFNVYNLRADPNFTIVMWCGKHRFKERAQMIVKNALEHLFLEGKLINTTTIDGIDEYSDVGINLRGTFCKVNTPRSWKSEDAIIVRQDTMITSDKELLTDRFLGCSALGFTFGGKNFLALVDNGTRVYCIKAAIAQNFDVEQLKADDNLTMVMWTGARNKLRFSERTIKEAIKQLGLAAKLVDNSCEVSPYSDVGVNAVQGPFCEDITIAKRRSLLGLRPF